MRVLGTVYVNTISLSVVLGLFLSPKTANIVRTTKVVKTNKSIARPLCL